MNEKEKLSRSKEDFIEHAIVSLIKKTVKSDISLVFSFLLSSNDFFRLLLRYKMIGYLWTPILDTDFRKQDVSNKLIKLLIFTHAFPPFPTIPTEIVASDQDKN